MQNLQEHQLRVAAVAQLVCDSIEGFTETKDVVAACLLHDMGNIIKFDLTYFPEFVQPEGLEHWQKVKDEFVLKYGDDEHIATEHIAREVMASKSTLDFVDNVGFRKLPITEAGTSLGQKICAYADMRVGPKGVLSIEKRTTDLRVRYEGRVRQKMTPENLDACVEAL
jgi:HD domain